MRAPQPPALEVRLLGALEVRRRGAPVVFPPSKKTRALLAYLVATGRPHSRERLCDLLWENANDPRAELRWSLSKLRPLLEADGATRIASERGRIAFEPRGAMVDLAWVRESLLPAAGAVPVDVLEAAVERLRGDFIEGLELPRCRRFDAWCAAEREAVRVLRIGALTALVERLDAEPERALGYARERLVHEPFAEAAHIAVIRLLGRLGRVREALEQHQSCREALRRELGIQPSRELEAARRALQSPVSGVATAPPRSVEAASPRVPKPPAPPARRVPPLVGRRAERDAIQATIDAVASSSSSPVLLFAGAPGIGKTRLLEELGTRVRDAGGTVLAGRGFEAELIRPYGAWVDALRGVAHERIPPELRAEIAPLLPELGAPPAEQADRNRLFEAVVMLLAHHAEDRPLAVALDDLQWLDEASIALLHFAARRLDGTHVLFACAARPAELEDNAAALRFVRALDRESRLRRIELAPLDARHTAELVRPLGAELDPERIFRESAGNPLFSLEIARALSAGEGAVSATLEGLIDGRLARLSERARDVVPWAAALGHDFTLDVLSRVVDLPPSELLRAVEELERRGILRAEADRLDFAHDLVRRTAYRRISEPRRRMVHDRIARALAGVDRLERGATVEFDPALAGDVAHHAALGGDDELAARACLGATRRALWLFAYDDAAELIARGIRHAEDLPPAVRIELQLELFGLYVEPAMREHRPADLEDELTRLTAEAQAAGLPAEVHRGLLHVCHLFFHSGDFTGALDRSRRAEQAGRAADPATVVRAIAHNARCLGMIESNMAQAEKLAREAEVLAAGIEEEMQEVPHALGHVHYHAGRLDEAARSFRRAVAAARQERDHWYEWYCLSRLPMIELERGRPAEARERCRELRPVAARMGEGSEAPFVEALDALARLALGETAARTALDAALTRLREVDSKAMLAYVQVAAGDLELDAGAIESARARGTEALGAADAAGRASTAALARALLARCSLEAGDPAAARRHLEAARESPGGLDALSARARGAVEAVAARLAKTPT
ncbi:MAG TPA: AAA family ATPase [Longimicrobiales bacterium]